MKIPGCFMLLALTGPPEVEFYRLIFCIEACCEANVTTLSSGFSG